jgi:hypothetical protein
LTLTPAGINVIARQGIALIGNERLRKAIDDVYQSPIAVRAASAATEAFLRLTSSRWPIESLCRFLSGWRSTHGTALYVSGLIVRLHRAARASSPRSRLVLYEAAAELCEVIPEDTGIEHIPHNELFDRFANHIVGSDKWKLDINSLPECERFRVYVKEGRLSAPIQEAILITAAAENWNTGEYTYLNGLVTPWMTKVLGQETALAAEKASYVEVHAGETELGHFLHAIHAWELYCEATGQDADPRVAARAVETYLSRVAAVFDELLNALMDIT